jgi:DNA replication protein DnaC
VTSNLPFQEWTEVPGSERLTGALLDRLTHHVHILEMSARVSFRLAVWRLHAITNDGHTLQPLLP